MAIKIKMQIVREDTKYESYRITIPRAIIQAHDLRNKDFELKVKDKNLILVPVRK